MSDIPTCTNCGKRPGSRSWGDYRHSVPRCDICVYKPQIKHALGRTVALPTLTFKLITAYIREVIT